LPRTRSNMASSARDLLNKWRPDCVWSRVGLRRRTHRSSTQACG
jgi:hypothetical protein